jgi:hypothetical protein
LRTAGATVAAGAAGVVGAQPAIIETSMTNVIMVCNGLFKRFTFNMDYLLF